VSPVIVGLSSVPQQIPFAVISPPPSLIILPPEVAVVYAISVTSFVVTSGGLALSFLQELIKTRDNAKTINPEIFIIFFMAEI
jgi:hypothetical protein